MTNSFLLFLHSSSIGWRAVRNLKLPQPTLLLSSQPSLHYKLTSPAEMISTYALALIVIVAWWIYSNVSGLLKNIAAAKRSGLPWYIVRKSTRFKPLHPTCAHQYPAVNAYGIFWILTNKLWLPVLNRLPEAWTKNWLVYVASRKSYNCVGIS